MARCRPCAERARLHGAGGRHTGDIGSHFASICKAMGANTLGVRRDPTRTAEGIDRMYRIGERKALCSRRTSDESPALNG